MATIPWHDLKGERAESFISIMILREYPDGRRRRPIQGDGGIDVIVPVSDNPRKYDIYQIKSFFPKLESGHMGKIKKSAEKLLETIERTDIEVEKWHLVVPIDPSEGDESWLESLFEDTSIAVYWKGWTYLEGMAAKYRDVVDVYVENGQERLLKMIENAMSTASLKRIPNRASVSLDQAYDMALPLFEQLNADDPQYFYNVSFLNGPPDWSTVPDSVAMSQFIGKASGPTMRIDVHPKYLLALEDRPIESSISFAVPDSEPELQKAVEDFRTYGEDVTIPAQYASGTFTDPLSGETETYESLEVRIWSEERKKPARIRLIAADQTGRRLASTFFMVDRLSGGPSGKGLKATMVSDSGMIRIVHWVKSVGDGLYSGTFNFEVDFSRPRLAVRVRDELKFLRQLCVPNKMVLAHEFTGPFVDLAVLEDVPAPVVAEWMVRYADSLYDLQDFANVPLEMGEPADHYDDHLKAVKHGIAVAGLLRGGKMVMTGTPELIAYMPDVDAQSIVDRVAETGSLYIRTQFQQRVANGVVTFPSALHKAEGITARVDSASDGRQFAVLSGVEGPAVMTVELEDEA
ncbi:MAG: hypothetical protein GEV09_00690 [Pseudonocardiaceae bacterium]|nr:hypothetical protein [Pseudonocardiaceae bacterium]